MTKIFKSADLHNRELKVDVLFGSPRLIINDFDGDSKGFIYEKADAPALALETLEKAGFKEDPDPMNHFELAMYHLMEGLKEQERNTAEAKEQAELEAEALGYWKAFHSVMGQGVEDDVRWTDLMPETQTKWLAVVRKAREVSGSVEK